MNSSKKRLASNTFMLYILQFSNYFFNFVTVPYQTRIMGPVYYGKLGLAVALISYFQLYLDFGFILSATADIAKKRSSATEVRKIFTSVCMIKCLLSITVFIFLGILCLLIPRFHEDAPLYLLYGLSAVIYCFLPDYLYRGLEQMGIITYRTIFVKAVFTVLIFIFLRTPQDYLIVPISLAAGNFCAVIWSFYDVLFKRKLYFIKVGFNDIRHCFNKSKTFFLSRIVSTIYTTTNTIILGFIDPTGLSIGYYTAADRLMTAGKSALSPISDSIYPYMIKNRDFKLIKKIILVFMPPIIIFSVFAFIAAPQLCVFIFGPEFISTANILRILMPIAIITLPSYLLGFPALGAVGLSQYANYSTLFATVVHIFLLVILYVFGALNVYSLSALSALAELNIMLYRFWAIKRYKNLFR